jgi:hypothetical protein
VIGGTIDYLRATFPRAHVWVIDDDSEDGTASIVGIRAWADPMVHLVRRSRPHAPDRQGRHAQLRVRVPRPVAPGHCRRRPDHPYFAPCAAAEAVLVSPWTRIPAGGLSAKRVPSRSSIRPTWACRGCPQIPYRICGTGRRATLRKTPESSASVCWPACRKRASFRSIRTIGQV